MSKNNKFSEIISNNIAQHESIVNIVKSHNFRMIFHKFVRILRNLAIIVQIWQNHDKSAHYCMNLHRFVQICQNSDKSAQICTDLLEFLMNLGILVQI